MGWSRGASIAAGILGTAFLYIASSPWLVWHSHNATQTRYLVFKTIPPVLQGEGATDFTSLIDRWRFVATHASAAAWQATLSSLVVERVPLHPAALLYTDAWFTEPTTVMATRKGGEIRFTARSTSPFPSPNLGEGNLPSTHYQLLTTHLTSGLALALPGSSLAVLPATLQDTWNELLWTHLGFTHTKPDIMAALADFEHIMISVKDYEALVGIVASSEDEAQSWATLSEGWVVAEDRFRRPVERAFKLPDGTLGREIVAGLPGTVWNDGDDERCRTPLPGKPALWSCARDTHHVLANHYWPGSDTISGERAWEVFIGSDFLAALPEVATLHAWGTTESAAGVVTLVGSE